MQARLIKDVCNGWFGPFHGGQTACGVAELGCGSTVGDVYYELPLK
jgi:hypothetical protein